MHFLTLLGVLLGIEGIVPYVLGYLPTIPTLVVGVIPLRLAYMVVPLRLEAPSAVALAAIYSSAPSSFYHYSCKN